MIYDGVTYVWALFLVNFVSAIASIVVVFTRPHPPVCLSTTSIYFQSRQDVNLLDLSL